MKTLKEQLLERNQLNKSLYKNVKSLVADLFKPIFDKYPLLENFSWAQGEVYNDEGYDFDVSTDSDSIWINDDQELDDAWAADAAEAISEELDLLNEDDYRSMFGTDTKITVTKTEMKIENYDFGC